MKQNADNEQRAGVYCPGLNGRGGAERLSLVLALELQRQGFTTFVFTDTVVDPSDLARDIGSDVSGLHFVLLSGPTGDGGRLREVTRLRRMWSHRRQIHRFTLDLFVNAKYKSALPGCGRRNIYYCHFPHRLPVDRSGMWGRAYQWAMSALDHRVVCRNPGGFLATYDEYWANSEFTAGHVVERWGREPIVVYPPCETLEPSTKQRVIAVVGRFQATGENVPHKAQDVLLRTFATMTDLHDRGWTLLMVGGTSPEGANYLASLVEEARNLPVTIVQDASRAQIRELLGVASLYWHGQGIAGDAQRYPETQEHFGISAVEAMSAGAIPVVFGSAGPAEIVSGVPKVRTWSEPDELALLTRHWVAAPTAEVAQVRELCRERAATFDERHFRARVGSLL